MTTATAQGAGANASANASATANNVSSTAAPAASRDRESFARVRRVVGQLPHTRRNVVERTKPETITATVNLLAGKGKPRSGGSSKNPGAAKTKEKLEKD